MAQQLDEVLKELEEGKESAGKGAAKKTDRIANIFQAGNQALGSLGQLGNMLGSSSSSGTSEMPDELKRAFEQQIRETGSYIAKHDASPNGYYQNPLADMFSSTRTTAATSTQNTNTTATNTTTAVAQSTSTSNSSANPFKLKLA